LQQKALETTQALKSDGSIGHTPPKAGGHPRLSLVVDDLNKLVRHPERIVESTQVALLPSLSGDEEHKRVEGPPERLQGEGNQ
jgi:hypothetical protein